MTEETAFDFELLFGSWLQCNIDVLFSPKFMMKTKLTRRSCIVLWYINIDVRSIYLGISSTFAWHSWHHYWYDIYIIISQNIRYLLWNRGFCRSLNNTYPIFLIPCIRCTNHLCDSCDLTDVNPHFIPSLLRKIQNVDLLWRHRY